MAQVQLFLPWEIQLAISMLNKTIAQIIPNTQVQLAIYQGLLTLQFPLTVDMVRAQIGYEPHPDGANAPQRGAMLIYQDDPGAQAGDSTVPATVLVGTWNSLVAVNKSSGSPVTNLYLQSLYPVLFAAATAAAQASNGSLVLLT